MQRPEALDELNEDLQCPPQLVPPALRTSEEFALGNRIRSTGIVCTRMGAVMGAREELLKVKARRERMEFHRELGTAFLMDELHMVLKFAVGLERRITARTF